MVNDCEFRCKTAIDGVFYCRHTAVRIAHNLVSENICRHCTRYSQECRNPRPIPNGLAGEEIALRDRGLGDTIARLLSKCRIKKWRGCKCEKRREWLNRILPYRRR